MRILDEHHHTYDEVHGYTVQAREILDGLGIEDAERVTLYPVLVTLLSQRSIQYAVTSAIPPGAQLLG